MLSLSRQACGCWGVCGYRGRFWGRYWHGEVLQYQVPGQWPGAPLCGARGHGQGPEDARWGPGSHPRDAPPSGIPAGGCSWAISKLLLTIFLNRWNRGPLVNNQQGNFF